MGRHYTPPPTRSWTAVLAVATIITTVLSQGAGVPQARASAYGIADWRLRSPSTQPTNVRHGTLVHFPPTRTVLLVDNNADHPGATTWSWNGQNWVDLNPPTTPSDRNEPAVAYHPASGKVVMFGGWNNSQGLLNDTWTFDGVTWTQQFPSVSPPVRGGAAIAHDAHTGGLILFGGWCGNLACGNNNLKNDTWLWNGVTWLQLSPSQSPSPRTGVVMSSSTATGNIVMFGGTNYVTELAETWTWNGSTWLHRPTQSQPPAQSDGTAAFADALSEVIFVGKNYETWSWNGAAWSRLSPATTPYRDSWPGLAFDPSHAEVVLYEGYTTQTFGTLNSDFPVPPVGQVTGYPSEDCDGGVVADGFFGHAYVRVRAQQRDPRTAWVCVRVDGASTNLGGRFVLTDAAGFLPGTPAIDGDVAACAASGNTVPGPHPLLSGAVGDPNDPSTYVPYRFDSYADGDEASICVTLGSVSHRVRVASAGGAPPNVAFLQDVPGSRMPPAAAAPATPSGTCQNGVGGAQQRFVNAAIGSTHVWAYEWQPSSSVVRLCARADGPAGAGGMLTIDAGAAGTALPSVTTSGDLTPCTVRVFRNESPVVVELRRSATGALPASVCLTVEGASIRVTASAGSGGTPATVTWTPDP